MISSSTSGLVESGQPLLALLAIAFGSAVFVVGRATWRGEELPAVVEHQRTHGPMSTPTAMGGRRLYKTLLGVGHVGVPIGIGFALMGCNEMGRILAHLPRSHWFVASVTAVAMTLVGAGFLYSQVYLWFGVPDRLRPPAQRGWRMGKDGYELIRPEAVPSSERPAPPVEWPEERDLW